MFWGDPDRGSPPQGASSPAQKDTELLFSSITLSAQNHPSSSAHLTPTCMRFPTSLSTCQLGLLPPMHPWSHPRAAPHILDCHIPAPKTSASSLELVCLSQEVDKPRRHENQDFFDLPSTLVHSSDTCRSYDTAIRPFTHPCSETLNQQETVQLLCELSAFAHLNSNICMRFKYCIQWIR